MPTETTDPKTPIVNSNDEQQLRELAVKEIERKRRFGMWAFCCAAASSLLVIILAISFQRKPITESQIRREMDRLTGAR